MRLPCCGSMSSPSSSSSCSASSTRYRRSFTKHSAWGRFHSQVIERRCTPAREKTCSRPLPVSQTKSSLPTLQSMRIHHGALTAQTGGRAAASGRRGRRSRPACRAVNVEHAAEQPTGGEHRDCDGFVRILPIRDLGAVVSEAGDVIAAIEDRVNELLAGAMLQTTGLNVGRKQLLIMLMSRRSMRTVEQDLTTSCSSPPGTTVMSNLLVPRWSRSSGMSSATRVRRCRPSLIAFQPSAHREHPTAAAPSSSRSGASRCGTRSLESSTPSTAHCASGLCAARMASARFLC